MAESNATASKACGLVSTQLCGMLSGLLTVKATPCPAFTRSSFCANCSPVAVSKVISCGGLPQTSVSQRTGRICVDATGGGAACAWAAFGIAV